MPGGGRVIYHRRMYAFVAMAGVVVLSAGLLRARPLPALALLLAGSVAALLAKHQDPRQIAGWLLLLPAGIEVCFIAATRPRRTSVTAAVMALALPAVPLQVHLGPLALLAVAVTTVVAWLTGHSIRQSHLHSEALHTHAILNERLQIARELHDMVAHSIGVIAIQAGMGSRVIATQPGQARDALAAIEATSRQTLAGLRQMLGALRQAGPGSGPGLLPVDPPPGLDDLDRLAGATRDAGVHVEVRWEGPRRPLPTEVDLSAFRIIQEAVTNVIRHAGTGSCLVSIDCREEEVLIEVTDNGRGGGAAGTGYGIAGMRERAGLLGGQLTAVPRPGGGFRVAARLPVPAAGLMTAS
jgi:signal transduction histidine kinase